MTTTRVKRLILAPHGDDETLGCGGLLAKYPKECFVAVVAEPDDVRLKEFMIAHEILGYAGYRVLNFQDGYLDQDPHALVGALDRLVADLRPRAMYVPYPSSHQDHIAVYEAGVRAGRLSMSPGHHYVPSVFAYDVAAYDLELYPTSLQWNVFESLTERQIDLKIQALEAYSSESVTGPHPTNGLKQLAQACGNARQLDWAEPYALIREVRL
jgi:LmbE family N-acetylglucosaminyl deacetylase